MIFFLARCRCAAALVAMAFTSLSFAMHADYITATIPDCADWTDAVAVLRETVEPKISDAALGTLPRQEKDSILGILQKTYASLPSGKKTVLSLKTILLKSLVLLYLGEGGRTTAFEQALSMLDAATHSYPGCPQLAWMRGLHLLKRGSLSDGIGVLDSLRSTGLNEKEFLSDYARSFFYAVIPKKSDTFSLLVRDPGAMQRADTASPQVFRWKVITSQKIPLPFFEYEAAFAFRKPFSLQFDTPFSRSVGSAMLRYGSIEPQSASSVNFLGQLSQRIDSAWCAIHIDVNDISISPFEYLLKRINGIYDSIGVKSDLPRYGAISLRCYNRGIWGRQGSRTAYIVFDRTIADIMRLSFPLKRLRRQDAGRKIRFTITMRSGSDVEEQAETKLQSVIAAF